MEFELCRRVYRKIPIIKNNNEPYGSDYVTLNIEWIGLSITSTSPTSFLAIHQSTINHHHHVLQQAENPLFFQRTGSAEVGHPSASIKISTANTYRDTVLRLPSAPPASQRAFTTSSASMLSASSLSVSPLFIPLYSIYHIITISSPFTFSFFILPFDSLPFTPVAACLGEHRLTVPQTSSIPTPPRKTRNLISIAREVRRHRGPGGVVGAPARVPGGLGEAAEAVVAVLGRARDPGDVLGAWMMFGDRSVGVVGEEDG